MEIEDKVFGLGPSFVALAKLGQGSYGSVYKVYDKNTQKEYAVKIIKQLLETEGVPSNVIREVGILKKMNHPNIIHLNQVAQSKSHTELLLDYCDYDLKRFQESYQRDTSILNEMTIKHIMYQVIKGMDYLHSKLIIHRDLKPQNILLDKNGQVKIADFGLSRKYSVPNKPYTKEVATLWYRAPELLIGNCNYSIVLDIWSIGCIFAELYLNSPLFQGESEIDQLNKIKKVFGTSEFEKMPSYSAFKTNFPYIQKTHQSSLFTLINEKSNIKMSESCFNLIEQMLIIDPMKRITCKDALKHECFKDVSSLLVKEIL